MIRTRLYGVLALVSVGTLMTLPVACQSGGIGDPCTPEDEYNTQFPGFKVEQENIESRSFQCQTGICLVNHFQGRTNCPAGQPPPAQCNGLGDTSCSNGRACVLSQTYAPACAPCDRADPTCVDTCQAAGFADRCDAGSSYCGCTSDQTISGVQFRCEPAANCTTGSCPRVLNSYVCHQPATDTITNCQTATDTVETARGKECCVPGTDTPISVSVCGQCDAISKRNADQAVYCSARCCVPCCGPCRNDPSKLCAPDGEDPASPNCSTDTSICGPACDPNFNYANCPSGYSCTAIRSNAGLGDGQHAGAYCIKTGTAYLPTSAGMCGAGALGGYVGDTSCAP